MALTLNFAFGKPCDSGGHIPVTATLAGDIDAAWTTTIQRETLLEPPGQEERHAMVEVLLRLLVRQLPVKTPATVKAQIEATTLNLTVGV